MNVCSVLFLTRGLNIESVTLIISAFGLNSLVKGLGLERGVMGEAFQSEHDYLYCFHIFSV